MLAMETIQLTFLELIVDEVTSFFVQPNPYRSVIILVISIVVAYWLSHFVAQFIILVARNVSYRSDNESDAVRAVRLRQIETYLSVTVAAVRVLIVAVIAYLVWRILSPQGSEGLGGSGAAAIGASAAFIVIASQTLGPILRDITAGATMIIERWFNVGDYIKVEPFIDVTGVVERLTLRSTRLRSLSGEVIFIHNQKIDAVHVTPNGVRTLAVDVFVNDKEAGEAFVRTVMDTLPTGPMMLAKAPKITRVKQWGEDVWHVAVQGQTPPGREWLIEDYFLNGLRDVDLAKPKAQRLMVHSPIARYADPDAERRFARAIRVNKDK